MPARARVHAKAPWTWYTLGQSAIGSAPCDQTHSWQMTANSGQTRLISPGSLAPRVTPRLTRCAISLSGTYSTGSAPTAGGWSG